MQTYYDTLPPRARADAVRFLTMWEAFTGKPAGFWLAYAPWAEVDRELMLDFLASIDATTPGYTRKARGWLRSLLLQVGRHDLDATDQSRRPVTPLLNDETATALIHAVKGNTSTQEARDRAVLRLLLDSGITLAEIGALTWEDLNLPQGMMIIRKDAAVVRYRLTTGTLNALHTWHALTDGTGPVVRRVDSVGRVGGPCSTRAICDIVTRAGRAIGLPNLSPNDIRRWWQQRAREGGVPVELSNLAALR